MSDLIDRLKNGVASTGDLHSDNETELFHVDDASETMAEAANRIVALEAQLAERVKIKPLEWSPVEEWKECSRERAPAFGGEYQIVMLDPGESELPSLYFEIGLGAFMFRFEQDQDPMGLPGETSPKKFPSVNAAKAAAQADYERRILSALEPFTRDTSTVDAHETANVSDKPEGQQEPVAWGDREDDMSAAILESHPVRSKSYSTYEQAMELVSNRHSKGALVMLVNHLLIQAEARADKLEELENDLSIAQGNTDAAIEDYNNAINALAEKDKEIKALREALEAMLEPFEGDDCRYDHHGYCQAHFLQEGDECCVKIARRVLEGGKVDG